MTKFFGSSGIGPILALFVCFGTPAATIAAPTVLEGGRLLDVEGGYYVDDLALVIDGERISSILRRDPERTAYPVGADVVDLSGLTLLPGLVDMHVHTHGVDREGRRTGRWTYSLLLSQGVTTARDTGNDIAWILAERARSQAGEIVAPRLSVVGAVLESQPTTHASPFTWGLSGPDDARQKVERLAGMGVDWIKAYSRTKDDELVAVIEAAKAQGLPFIAHQRDVGILRPVELGAATAEHLIGVPESANGGPPPLPPGYDDNNRAHRFQHWFGKNWLQATDDDLRRVAEAIAGSPTAMVPTLVTWEAIARRNDPDFRAEVPMDLVERELRDAWQEGDEGIATGWTEEEFRVARQALERRKAFVKMLVDAGGTVAVGTDTPVSYVVPGYGVHREIEILVEAGLTPLQSVQAATVVSARLLGWETELGSLRAGKIADIVAIEGDPLADITAIRNVRRVWLRGEELDRSALLEEARRFAPPPSSD